MRRRRHGMSSGQCRALAAVRGCKEVLPAFKVIPSGDGFRGVVLCVAKREYDVFSRYDTGHARNLV